MKGFDLTAGSADARGRLSLAMAALLTPLRKLGELPPVRKIRDQLQARPKLGAALGWVLVFAVLAYLHSRAFRAHITSASDPLRFNDDVRQQVYPFFRYSQPEQFPNDYLGTYFLDCMPLGYRAIYTTAALAWDAEALSKSMPYLLMLITVGAVAVASARIGSRWTALASASIVLGGTWFISRMTGGLPRSFASPFLALGVLLLALGRLRLLAALVPLTAGFYPAAAAPLGLTLVFSVLFLPAADRGDVEQWSLRRRLALVAGSGALTVALLMPTVILSNKYGAAITPSMLKEYPEAGPGGRYIPEDRAPFPPFFPASIDAARTGFSEPGGEPFVKPLAEWLDKDRIPQRRAVVEDLLFLAILLGGASLARHNVAARRIMLLGGAAFAGYLVSRFVAPYLYLPARYLQYPLPVLAVTLLPAGAAEITRLLPENLRQRARPAILAATAVLLLLLLGTRGSDNAGLTVRHHKDRVSDAMAALPKGAVLAGFPGGPIENVPYSLRRQAFLTFELHQAFHTAFVDETRRRMRALVDAYFATSTEPLIRLRDEFGVTYLLVQKSHLKGSPPKYHAPYQRWIEDAQRRAAGKEFVALQLAEGHAQYADNNYAIIDLRQIELTPAKPSQPAAPSEPAPVEPPQGSSN
jgi:hypothetical protein